MKGAGQLATAIGTLMRPTEVGFGCRAGADSDAIMTETFKFDREMRCRQPPVTRQIVIGWQAAPLPGLSVRMTPRGG